MHTEEEMMIHLRGDVQASSDEVGVAGQSLSQGDHRIELPSREGCRGIRQDSIADAHRQGAAHFRCNQRSPCHICSNYRA